MLDVAIIGAGAAGLGAAKVAQSKGLSFEVLEAASFAGGRARTDTTALGMPFDLGCRSFYGDGENPFLAVAKESGTRLGPVSEKMLFHDGSAFLDAKQNEAAILGYERLEAELLSAHEKLANSPNPQDRSQADVIDMHNPMARYFLSVRQLDGAPSEVSLLDPTHRGGTDYAEVLDGYGALILRAAAGVPVSLNCPVSAIDLSGPFVVLDTPEGQLQARTVVLTVSTAVLAAERIALRPGGWPNEKVTAIDGLPMVSCTKVGIRLKPNTLTRDYDSLLGEGGASTDIYCAMNEPENALWTLGSGGGDQALVYIGGSFSRELALAGEAAQIAWAKEHLSKLLGASIQHSFMAACATPFDREPWIDGGYSYCRYGSGNQRPALAEPIEDRIFFAGEACSLDHATSAHGAWLSGGRAIEQIAKIQS